MTVIETRQKQPSAGSRRLTASRRAECWHFGLTAFASFLALLALLFVPSYAKAKETPHTLAQKLQEQFLSAPGVELSFDLKHQGHIQFTADLRGGHVRLESPSLLIISDGKTVWSYDKKADQVTIDDVTASSDFHDPASMFRFADNYTPNILSESGARYTLELTPAKQLQSLLHAAGEMQSLRLDLVVHGPQVRILSAAASSSRGTAEVRNLKITTLTHSSPSDFVFQPKASTKMIDLRE